jgi:hypothetical protein
LSCQYEFLAEACESGNPGSARPFCRAAREDHLVTGLRQFGRDCGEAFLRPEPASVSGSGVNHRCPLPVRPRGRQLQPEIAGIGLDAVPLQQPGPPLTLMDVVFPEWAKPVIRGMRYDPPRPECLDP